MLVMASCVARPPALRIAGAWMFGPRNSSGTVRGSRHVTVSDSIQHGALEVKGLEVQTNYDCATILERCSAHLFHRCGGLPCLCKLLVVFKKALDPGVDGRHLGDCVRIS